MASTAFTVRGFKVRTTSRFRFQIVMVVSEDIVTTYTYGDGQTRTHTTKAGASIQGRSNSLASAKDRAAEMRRNRRGDTRVAFAVVDLVTGEEV